MAYEIKNYTKKEVALLSENEVLTKKVSSVHFLEETTDLLKEIISKMKLKKTAERIYDKIDKFAQIWSTILEFPHLSKLTSREYNKLELEIKKWSKQQDEDFNASFK